MFLRGIGWLLLVTVGHCNVFSASGESSARRISGGFEDYAGLRRIDKFVDEDPMIQIKESTVSRARSCGSECLQAYDSCDDSTRRCIGIPSGCISSKTCQVLLSYGAGTEQIPITLYGTAPRPEYANNFWIGFGTSISGVMDQTAVVQCGHFASNVTKVVTAYNGDGHSYNSIPENGISGGSTNFIDGFASCSFNLNVVRNVSGIAYDLKNYYTLLVGSGWINATTDEMRWHLDIPWESPRKISLACGNDCQDASVYDKCGISRRCFGVPQGCVDLNNCNKLLAYGSGKEQIPVTLYGTAPKPEYANSFWVGFGTSLSGGMDQSAVVQCGRFTNNITKVVAAYNSIGHSYQVVPENGISEAATNFIDGFSSCSFNLSVVRNVSGLVYDLNNNYTLLLGSGWINGTTNEMKWHIEIPWASPKKIVLACGNDCEDASIYDQCGQSRRCFGVPEGCVATTNCSQLLSYGASDKSGSIPVDLYGTVESQQGFWIGFAPSRTGKMAIAAPVLCVKYPDGTTEVLAGFNSILHAGHHYQTLADPRYGIANVSSSVTNGYASCSFNLNATRQLFGVTFDLTYPYTLLLGAGNLDPTLKPTYHPVIPTILPKVVMACGNSCPSTQCVGENCFGVPEGCEETGECKALLTWKAENPTTLGGKETVKISLHGSSPTEESASNFWIGFGVSHTNNMEYTAVVQCLKSSNGSLALIAAYNSAGHRSSALNERIYGISDPTTEFVDGKLNCSFNLDVERSINNQSFSLREYLHVELASGPVSDSNGILVARKHFDTPRVSSTKLALACLSNCSENDTTTIAPATTTAGPQDSGTFGFPVGCEKKGDCKVLLKFQTNPSNSSLVSLVLIGRPDAGQEQLWFALGVGPQPKMEGAMVLECVRWKDGANLKTELFASYNKPSYNNVRTGTYGMHLISTAVESGVVSCNFEVDAVRTLVDTTSPTGANLTFDLNQPYYLLLAIGELSAGNNKAKHDDKVFSSIAVILNSNGGAVPAGVSSLASRKAHAVLMVISWNLAVAMGIFFARHSKDMWPNHEPFGVKLWFTLHRGHNLLAVILSLIAIIVIFVHVGEWLDVPHAYTGIITFALAFSQPIIAFFRPHPGTENRKYFNYLHWSIGYSAWILAVVSMVLGVWQQSIKVSEAAGYIVIGSAVYYALMHIALEVYKTMMIRNLAVVSTSQEKFGSGTFSQTTQTVVVQGLDPEDRVRYSLLTLTWLGLIGSTFAVVYLIGVA